MFLISLYLFVLTFVLSVFMVPATGKLARRLGFHDHPGGRKNHRAHTPLLGGLGIFGSIVLIVSSHWAGLYWLGLPPFLLKYLPVLASQSMVSSRGIDPAVIFLLGAVVLVVTGFIDDWYGIDFPFQVKFSSQLIAATLLVFSGIHTTFLPSLWMNYTLSIFWLVGITNAFNLLDNMDGLSSGVAAITGSILFLIFLQQEQHLLALVLSIYVGAVLGFLRHNFYPAKIFMGDTGSHFLGYVLGAATLLLPGAIIRQSVTLALAVLVPVLVLSVPIFDTLSVMVIRWREKRPLFVGDTSHLSHRLVARGMNEKNAVIFVYLLTAASSAAAVFLLFFPDWILIYALVQLAVISGSFSLCLSAKRKKVEIGDRAST